MTTLLRFTLTALAKCYLWRYRPMIIAVTGNAGKTSTKDAITEVVKGARMSVRASQGNLNNELGVPLSILGDFSEPYYHHGGSIGFWIRALSAGLWRCITDPNAPEVLVLEYAADRPGDIRRLVHAFRPHVAVVTSVGTIPVHVEYFKDPLHVAQEKGELVRHLSGDGYAILNCDDSLVASMRESAHAHVLTFGEGEDATVRFSNVEIAADPRGVPEGMTYKLHHAGTLIPVKVEGSLGISQAYATSAAAAVGVALGMNLVEVTQALARYRGPAGRMRILRGIRDTVIIDDTYNASPAAMHIALDTLGQVRGTRKVAILGDMRELGAYSIEAHEAVGQRIAEVADVLVCVGERAKLIASSATPRIPAEAIRTFHTADEARGKVQELIREGDTVLVKGSQGVRMEKIVKEIMAEPERAGELLVRQGGGWIEK